MPFGNTYIFVLSSLLSSPKLKIAINKKPKTTTTFLGTLGILNFNLFTYVCTYRHRHTPGMTTNFQTSWRLYYSCIFYCTIKLCKYHKQALDFQYFIFSLTKCLCRKWWLSSFCSWPMSSAGHCICCFCKNPTSCISPGHCTQSGR